MNSNKITMILLVHMIFGAAIGYSAFTATHSIFLAMLAALLTHYFLDLFPHIEYIESAEISITKLKTSGLKKRLPDIIKVLADFCIGLFLIFLFSTNNPLVYLFAFISIIPDGITVIYTIFRFTFLAKHQQFHVAIQYLTKQKKFPVFWRIFTQAIAVLSGLWFLGY